MFFLVRKILQTRGLSSETSPNAVTEFWEIPSLENYRKLIASDTNNVLAKFYLSILLLKLGGPPKHTVTDSSNILSLENLA